MRLEPFISHTGILITLYLSIILDLQKFLPLIYPPELEVKETTYTASSASFLDLYLEFDDSDQLSTQTKSVNNRKTENRNDLDLVQAFLKKWWVESDFKAPNLPLSLRLKGSGH
jgi:hypothetical protein